MTHGPVDTSEKQGQTGLPRGLSQYSVHVVDAGENTHLEFRWLGEGHPAMPACRCLSIMTSLRMRASMPVTHALELSGSPSYLDIENAGRSKLTRGL